MKKRNDLIVVGFALFAMFFGAGNLIFPPYLGLLTGTAWKIAMIGFIITGVGAPLLGVVATAKAGGHVETLANPVSKTFSAILSIVIILSIGPLFAIPRTAATTYEIGVLPFLGQPSALAAHITSIVFFLITMFFCLTPSDVVDRVGKYLTPALLIVLAILIVRGVFKPIGNIISIDSMGIFGRGFNEGYQTLDAFASVIFTAVIIDGVRHRGYTEEKEIVSMTMKAGAIAAVLLFLVYGGLGYLGATAGSIYPNTIDRTILISNIAYDVLGSAGAIVLSAAISLACLSTAIGLVASCGEFFSNLSKGKISYRTVVLITIAVSYALSILGVDRIIAFAGPVLEIAYPPVLVLIGLNLLGKKFVSTAVTRGGVIGSMLFSVTYVLANIFNWEAIINIIHKVPMGKSGFAWVFGALVGILITYITLAKNEREIA